MADYYPLLAKALANLPSRTTSTGRRAIYERARKALIGQLRSIQPPMPDKDIADEDAALDLAIARLEAEYAAQPPAPPPAPRPAATPAAARPGASTQPRAPTPGTRPAAAPMTAAAAAAQPGATPAAIAAAARRPLAPTPTRPLTTPTAAPQARPVAPPPPRRPPMSAAPPLAPPAPAIEPQSLTGEALSVLAPPVEARFAADEADGDLAPPVAVSPPAAVKASAEGVRPSAPGLETGRRRNPWPMFAAALAIGIAGAIALAAYFWRETPLDFAAKTRPPVPEITAPAGQSKIAERVAPGDEAPSAAGETPIPTLKVPVAPVTPAAASSAAAPAVPAQSPPDQAQATSPAKPAPSDQAPQVETAPQAQTAPQPQPSDKAQATLPAPTKQGAAQTAPLAQPATLAAPLVAAAPAAARAAILIATASDPQKPSVNLGSAIWSIVPAVAGQPSTLAVRVDVEIPEQKMHATVTIRKNADPALPATHTIDLRTTFADGAQIKGIKDMDLPRMRQSEAPTGDPLMGVHVKINDNYFLVGLSRTESDAPAHNLALLAKNDWFDFPLLLSDDRIAKLTFEKGATGEKVMAQALSAWN